MESFFSNIFSVQIATSSICICCSIYSLQFVNQITFPFRNAANLFSFFFAKNNNDNLMENIVYLACLVYNIFDTFVVMYFSNEIMVLSDRLAYCLFESDWISQNQLSKKCILIFGERLKQRQQLVILKIYPLTLQSFVRVC